MAERQLPKLNVAGSIPVSRSMFLRRSPELDSNPREWDLLEPENPSAVFSSSAMESKL